MVIHDLTISSTVGSHLSLCMVKDTEISMTSSTVGSFMIQHEKRITTGEGK